MAVIVDPRGNLTYAFPENGRAFSINELIELMGPQFSIFELEAATQGYSRDHARYILTIRNGREIGLDRNEAATNIYAPFMKGLTASSIYGTVLVCSSAELEPSEIPKTAKIPAGRKQA